MFAGRTSFVEVCGEAENLEISSLQSVQDSVLLQVCEGPGLPEPLFQNCCLNPEEDKQTHSICLKLEMDLLHWKASLDVEFIYKKLMRKSRILPFKD